MHVVRAPSARLASDASRTEWVDVEQAAWVKVPSWPSDVGQLERASGVGAPCHRQRAACAGCTLFFRPQDAEPGLTVAFQDGVDLWHRVTLKEPGDVVQCALPLSEKPRPGVQHKLITWEGRESKDTQVHSSSSVVACTLTYKPASMLYGNRVEIEVVPYEFAPAPTGSFRTRVRSGATGASSGDTRGLSGEDRPEEDRRRVDGFWRRLLAEAEAGAAPEGAAAAAPAAPGAAAAAGDAEALAPTVVAAPSLAAMGRELLAGGIFHGRHSEEKDAICEARVYEAPQSARARAYSDVPQMLSVTGAGMAPVGHDGSFDWLRKQNGREDRRRRQEIAATTLAVCAIGGYSLDDRWIELSCVDRMCENTQLVMAPPEAVESNAEALAGETPSASSSSIIWRTYQGQNSIEIAMERARDGLPVAVVNAGSAYSVGGGFLKGGRHALEESICTRSTLFRSLSIAQHRATEAGVKPSVHAVPPLGPGGAAWEVHIPEEGAVLSPDVEVFRAGTHDGYRFLREAVRLQAVVTVAMPNNNARVSDAPVDAPPAPGRLLREKFAAALEAAKQSRAAVLVVPDVGCGVYGNDPKAVGDALGSVVLTRFPRTFSEIILVGSPAFCEAARTRGRGTP